MDVFSMGAQSLGLWPFKPGTSMLAITIIAMSGPEEKASLSAPSHFPSVFFSCWLA